MLWCSSTPEIVSTSFCVLLCVCAHSFLPAYTHFPPSLLPLFSLFPHHPLVPHYLPPKYQGGMLVWQEKCSLRASVVLHSWVETRSFISLCGAASVVRAVLLSHTLRWHWDAQGNLSDVGPNEDVYISISRPREADSSSQGLEAKASSGLCSSSSVRQAFLWWLIIWVAWKASLKLALQQEYY